MASLISAAAEGDMDTIRTSLQQGECTVNFCDLNGLTPLHYACQRGDLNVVNMLVSEFKADLTIRDCNGYTPLHCACEEGHLNVANALISEFNADIYTQDKSGSTLLHCVAKKGHLDVLKMLVSEASLGDVKDDSGRIALHYACEAGNLDAVRVLVSEFKAEVAMRDNTGCTPLHYACAYGYLDIIEVLVSKFKADLEETEAYGRTPMHLACMNGNLGTVKVLLEYKVDLTIQDDNGYAPLHYACTKNQVEVVKVLLTSENKAYLTIPYSNGCTLLHDACHMGYLDIVEMLVSEVREALDLIDSKGRTPLHYAHDSDVVRMLVTKFKADVSIQDKSGHTPLHYACHDTFVEALARSTLLNYDACMKKQVNLIQALLLSESKAHLTIQDKTGCIPLHYACKSGEVEIVKVLMSEVKVKAALTVQDKFGYTPLHYACRRARASHLSMVELLVSEFKKGVIMQDYTGCTPLHYACVCGYLSIVKALVSKFKTDLLVKEAFGRTPLHFACMHGHLDTVKVLLETKVDLSIQDEDGCTPLHYACKRNLVDVVKVLLLSEDKAHLTIPDKNGCIPLHDACHLGYLDIVEMLAPEIRKVLRSRANSPFHMDVVMSEFEAFGRTPLHYACMSGHLDIVRVMVSKFRADLSLRDVDGWSPLMLAARNGHKDVGLALLHDYRCPVTDTDKYGWGVLHHACAGGSVSLVHTLIRDYKADVNTIRENYFDIASIDVTFSLIYEFGFDPNVANKEGLTPLHYACYRGDVDLVRALVHEHKADANAYNKAMDTPLHLAFKTGQLEAVLALLSDPNCDPNAGDEQGQTVLHIASTNRKKGVVNALLQIHRTDVNVRTNKQDTPLHMAAREGHYDVVLALVSDARCDCSARGRLERTALHEAARHGHHKITEVLLKLTSPLAMDQYGDTPLHLACEFSYQYLYDNANADAPFSPVRAGDTPRGISTVQCLLHGNAPVLVGNASGNTPRDLARGQCKRIIEEYVQNPEFQNHYVTIFGLAKKKYSGSHWITRIFVLGNPGAGKSSFVESLKREGFFKSFSKVSKTSVPLHTAGIIPSVHMSSQYGRVLFYDFAGDVEYYSSHAAIFESLASSKKGGNIFVLVVDLREDSAAIITTLYYWFSFIQYQKFPRSSFVVIGSHLDQSAEQECLNEFCTAMQPNVHNITHFMLDCRDPRSNRITQFKKQISTWISESQKYELSSEAKVLLGLLEKDFSAVTASPVQRLVSHIKLSGGWIPVHSIALHKILLELHEVGVLLLLGDCTKDTDHVILDISKLTNEVHELLFSDYAISSRSKSASLYNIGILPESVLEKILPQYITKECLVHLQYCQEIHHTDVPFFPSLEQDNSSSQSFLFFPALCSVDKSEVSWDESTDGSYSLSWLAQCTDPHDYFPPRFLHVLLLRLVYGFTLSPGRLQTPHHVYNCCCTMWKRGVHWVMEEGVDCMVELVNGGRGVVVLSKSSMDAADDCARIFTEVVSYAMEAKAEFCHSIKPEFYFLDSSAEEDYFNEDHQFEARKVKDSLQNPEGKRVVISVSHKGKVELSKFQRLKRFTLWNSFFPFELKTVLHTLRVIVLDIFDLGLVLGVPFETHESIKVDFPHDVNRRRMEIVNWWMNNSPKPPCWYTLVEALEDIQRSTLAEELRKEHDLHIKLQKELLSEDNQTLKPDMEFLRSLSDVVGSRWLSLAVSLVLSEEIKGLKEMAAGLSQQELALQMLKIWASREEATYGQLCHKLQTMLLFQYIS